MTTRLKHRLTAISLAAVALVGACGGGNAGNGTGKTAVAANGSTGTAGTATAVSPTSSSAAAQPNSVSGPPASTAAQPGNPEAATVAAVGSHGEDLYDAIAANKWQAAGPIMDSLARASSSLSGSAATSPEAHQLSAVVDTLRRVVPARQHDAALEAANRVTYLAARMEAPYRPTTPVEVLLLDYYGRELQIWSAVHNTGRLATTRTELQATWNTLRPAIQARGRGDQATRTDSLVRQITASTSPAATARLAKPFLDEVDELEKVFTKQ